MSVAQAIVLAIIQGITEFLPISSDGHLVLGSWLFNWPDQGLLYDAAVHLGTLLAVIIYFRRTWASILTGFLNGGKVLFLEEGEQGAVMPARRVIWLVALATIPVAVAGYFVKDFLEENLRTPEVAAMSLLITGALLTAAELIGRRNRRLASATEKDSGVVGLFQVAALLPGLSRSGSTMSAAMMGDMTRDAAARFSFLLAVPAIGGAVIFVIADVIINEGFSGHPWGMFALGGGVSFITGYVAIAWLMRILRTRNFTPFIAYVLVVGVAVLIARAAGV
jgi:undecaprenyl-diphosphatase